MTTATAELPVARETIDIARIEGDLHVEEADPNRLPPDLGYCLDAEVEWGAITADERAFVDLFDDGAAGWFTGIADDGTRFASSIKERYAAWRRTASPDDMLALDWAGLRGLRWLFDECAQGIAGSATFRDRLLLTRSEQEISAGVLAAAFEDGDGSRFVKAAEPVVRRAARDVRKWGVERFRAAETRVERLYPLRREAMLERDWIIREWESTRRGETLEGRPDVASLLVPRKPKVETKRERRRFRKILTRSFSFLRSVAGVENARAWLSGDEVLVEGRRFDFRLRVADLRREGHGALDVFVTDKHGIELAKLCVYNPKTPALDQVVAMILHVVSGEEDRIVATGNVIRSTAAASLNPAFVEVRGITFREGREIVDLNEPYRLRDEALPRARAALAKRAAAEAFAPLDRWRRMPLPWDGVPALAA